MATALSDIPYSDDNDSTDNDDDTPDGQFFISILNNDVETVKQMVGAGFLALSRSPHGDLALHFACLNSRLDILHVLKDTLKEGEIDTINIEEDDTICGTALHMAMDGQVNPNIVEVLLSSGANPNALDAKGSPVLHELIYRAWEDLDNEFESEKYMRLNTEFDCNERTFVDALGVSYFMKLAILHKYGVDINIKHSETGLTPLHYWNQNFGWMPNSRLDRSVPEWCISFLIHLLEYGADVNVVSLRGESFMSFFAERKFKPIHVDFMASYGQLLACILPKVSDLMAVDCLFSRSLVHFAAEFSNHIMLEKLLEFHCDVNLKDKFGLSPLHLITHNITKDETAFTMKIIESLIKHGANINIQDDYGSTPLHHAVHMKSHSALEQLLGNGASTDVADKFNRTVKDLALIEGDQKTLDILGIAIKAGGHAIERNKSDARFGWFYPLCCHKEYESDSTGVEDPECVEFDLVDHWLDNFPMCIHNARMIIQNSISSLEENKEQMVLTEKDAVLMKQEAYELMKTVSKSIENRNLMFASNVIFGGSVSESTKVGSPDEVDFVFDLYKFRELISVEEEQGFPGFARVRVVNDYTVTKYGIKDVVDKNNYLNRTQISKIFHKYFEESLREKQVLQDKRFLFWHGTTNALGECSDIGQMNLIWYGPFEKRLTVSVDIAPVIRLTEWHSTHINNNIAKILGKDVTESTGCYLVMKNLTPVLNDILGNQEELDLNDHPILDKDEFLFKISLSQLEHATMKFLPQNIRLGYKLAKSIQLQCPNLLLSLKDVYDSVSSVDAITEDRKCVIHVAQYLTSFVLKTALFHELDQQNIRINCEKDDFSPDAWNSSVIQAAENTDQIVNKDDINEALSWALNIYKRLQILVHAKRMIPEYFLPVMKATKCPSGNEAFEKICGTFLKIMIYFLEHFKVPNDLDSVKDPKFSESCAYQVPKRK